MEGRHHSCMFAVLFTLTLSSSGGDLARNANGSRYNQLGITTPVSPYSPGESALGFREPEESQTSPPFDIRIQCDPSYEEVNIPKDPLPRCRPSLRLWELCFTNNPCGLYSECDVINGSLPSAHTRCSCMSGYEGRPPSCRPRPGHEVCRSETCGPNAACDPLGSARCRCAPGFVGKPPNCTAGPGLRSLCDPYPCGGYSSCSAGPRGAPHCSCLPGYVGRPPHCQPGPETWRVCFKVDTCGQHSVCTVEDRAAVCTRALTLTN